MQQTCDLGFLFDGLFPCFPVASVDAFHNFKHSEMTVQRIFHHCIKIINSINALVGIKSLVH